MEPGEGWRSAATRTRQPRPRGGGLLRPLRREELPAQASGPRVPHWAPGAHLNPTSLCQASRFKGTILGALFSLIFPVIFAGRIICCCFTAKQQYLCA